jgi:hypothetical protein
MSDNKKDSYDERRKKEIAEEKNKENVWNFLGIVFFCAVAFYMLRSFIDPNFGDKMDRCMGHSPGRGGAFMVFPFCTFTVDYK